ncbi:ABC transporter permease [Thermodesulforhabdus norvegica]|uniref:Peptide/nickel transport system permease protein n=1 Tax=Thermodesulforhabdus norvegica TaxID=39841 RepID=A0A1I4S702_9BACT|nr:ABC transporter permease [Thermodesulforhabdus norvegica]SFM60288.1 peptide/nickel transport system permease protein [Thermodesulforhabdus norvegica]
MKTIILHVVFVLGGLIVFALISPSMAPNDPSRISLADRFRPPCPEYPLGTDALGRCHLSRSLTAARTTIGRGIIASLCSLLGGVLIYCIARLGGRWLGLVVMTVNDALLAVPSIFIVLGLISAKGGADVTAIMGIGLYGVPWWVRFLSHVVPSAYERDFVVATRVAGVRGFRLMCHCVMPCIVPPIMTAFLIRTARFMLLFGTVGFIGFAGFASIPEWGGMLREGIPYLHRAPWLILGPFAGFTICGGILVFSADRISRLSPGDS